MELVKDVLVFISFWIWVVLLLMLMLLLVKGFFHTMDPLQEFDVDIV